MSAPSGPPLFVCGDLGSTECGVGASEAALLSASGVAVESVDPTRLVGATRAVWRARRAGRGAVVVYPTRSTTRSPRAFLVFAAVTLALRRHGVRWHLHEYAVFDELRRAVDLLLALGASTVVVSTEREAAIVRRALGGRIVRRAEVVVVPPANGSSLSVTTTPDPDAPPVVGTFGRARVDKAVDTIVDVLRRLPPEWGRFETVGSGWDGVDWPADVARRFTMAHHGHLATDDLADVLGRWTMAVVPYRDGATDGRMGLRTTLSAGVPTLTTVTHEADLTLHPVHLFTDVRIGAAQAEVFTAAERMDAAEEVARFEAEVLDSQARVLFGGTGELR